MRLRQFLRRFERAASTMHAHCIPFACTCFLHRICNVLVWFLGLAERVCSAAAGKGRGRRGSDFHQRREASGAQELNGPLWEVSAHVPLVCGLMQRRRINAVRGASRPPLSNAHPMNTTTSRLGAQPSSDIILVLVHRSLPSMP